MQVQVSQVHMQARRANGEFSDLANPSISAIVATEKYVSGYACKGIESNGSLSALFSDYVNTADETLGASVKRLVTKLLMSTVINSDISAVEASYELGTLLLYR